MLRITILVSLGLLAGGCATVQDDPGRPVTDAETFTTATVGGGVEVCELVGRDAIVKVLTTETGTRYTLCSLDGEAIASELEAADLARLRPDLDPRGMQADWGRGPLMMLDLGD